MPPSSSMRLYGPRERPRFVPRCVNNEKQIALAIHNYISAHKLLFPPAYTTDKAGKPLLSWRVLILPYLEQEALFKEFHLDEPWDSEHNRTLIAKMPATYRCPLENADTARQGKTRYLAPRGPSTIFRGAEPISLRDVTDGTSNTIMVLETGDDQAVIWTKPDDWEVPADPAPIPAGSLQRSSSATRSAGATARSRTAPSTSSGDDQTGHLTRPADRPRAAR